VKKMDLIDRQALLKQIDIDSDGEPGYYGDTWKFIDTIKNLPSATDNNVGTKLSTNLASLGTDCISRQAAIKAIDECYCGGEDSCGEPWIYKENVVEAIQMIEPIPPTEPQIIRCKNCKHREYYRESGYMCALDTGDPYMTARNAEDDDWFCADAERKEVTE
jgi:hypothetical protein